MAVRPILATASLRWSLAGVVIALLAAVVAWRALSANSGGDDQPSASGPRLALVKAATTLGLLSTGAQAAGPLPPPPPTRIGINVPSVQYYGTAVPFENLIMGSEWVGSRWQPLPDVHQDAAGDILSLPPEGVAQRFLSAPTTGPAGMEVVCTFAGSGTLTVGGAHVKAASSGDHTLRFRLTHARGEQLSAWLVLKNVDPDRPMRGLDCRDATVARSVRFRPKFVQTLRGYRVLRFMDWQNANANAPVRWATRHPAGSNRRDGDGIALEDMLALAREVDADPWFVMPWNADDDYVAGFAAQVSAALPPQRTVYVEVGNEVWNSGFPVSKQATREGTERGLGTAPREATMRRYAERTVEVMRIWERAFARRRGLVRVLATQHAVPFAAELALSHGNAAQHVDALATAPYFGSLIGGTGHTAEAMFARLDTELETTLSQARDNRAIAAKFGKRYIAYEGGQGLILPAEVPLQKQVQSDPRMYALYKRYLRGWKAEIGDLLCLLTSTAPISSHGAWGLTEYEEQGPADAPKLRAVIEER